ncbi:DnaJ-like protein [Tupanvirus soda lake]|uniref:DnaJ-like protein n=2 Tax=Tupanvirus TaxID=2094720 RepID=A0A6N1NW76_9VIRU|nr:DnaJ-like protein [Tupanvirus soda lake]QKU35513.1 DnaJ-like protein [Tupanvirus soda lake]
MNVKAHTELYDVLGLSPDASQEDIKKAYKKMAIKYHPDKNHSPEAPEIFKKVAHANEILSDPEKRKIYDQFGEEALKGGMGEDDFDPMDIFRRMNPHHQQEEAKQVMRKLKLEDYFTKKNVTIKINRDTRCEACDATGFTDKIAHKCKQCDGQGIIIQVIRQGPVLQQMQMPCPTCKGKKIDAAALGLKCNVCKAKGTVKTIEEIVVDIPQNITRRPVTIVPEKGPWHNGKYISLAVIFNLKLPKGYSMTSDKKLIYTMHINYPETLCGFRRTIDHPSGKKLMIVSEKGHVINPYHIYMLDKLGFGGDIMYLTFIIHYPERVSLPSTKKNLSFQAIESMLGNRREPNVESDNGVDPDNVYVLSTLNKIDNNPRANVPENDNDDSDEQEEMDDSDSDEDDFGPGMHGRHGGPGVGCAQQ